MYVSWLYNDHHQTAAKTTELEQLRMDLATSQAALKVEITTHAEDRANLNAKLDVCDTYVDHNI